MTLNEFIEECDQMKLEIIDIIKTYYHKSETIEENMRKFNTFFSLPISQADVEYIMNNDIPVLDNIKSVNAYIEYIKRKKYNKQYVNPVYSDDISLVIKTRQYYEPKRKPKVERKKKTNYPANRYKLTQKDIQLIYSSYDGSGTKRDAYDRLVIEKGVKFSYYTYVTYLRKYS